MLGDKQTNSDTQYSDCKATSRHPTTHDPNNRLYSSSWVNGEEQNWQKITGELQGAVDVNSNTLPETVYRLFSFRPSYEQFGTEGWSEGQPPKFYASLEGIHGRIHVFTGGAGQMGEVAVAAFDPVFWLVILFLHVSSIFD